MTNINILLYRAQERETTYRYASLNDEATFWEMRR